MRPGQYSRTSGSLDCCFKAAGVSSETASRSDLRVYVVVLGSTVSWTGKCFAGSCFEIAS